MLMWLKVFKDELSRERRAALVAKARRLILADRKASNLERKNPCP